MHPKLSCSDIHQLCSTQSPVAIICKQKMTGILRASPALGKVVMTQTGWKRMVIAWLGKPVFSQAVSELVLSTAPRSPDSPGRQNREACRRQVPFTAVQTSPECWQKNEWRLCIPRGSWDAIAFLGSAPRHCSFHVTLQGRQQSSCMPRSTLVPPPCPAFKAGLPAFYSNGYFPFAYAYDHLLAP